MDPLELLKKSNQQATNFVENIKDDQWELPTITEYNVKELVNHALDLNCLAPEILKGASKEETDPKWGQDNLQGRSPLEAWREGLKLAEDALSEEGALEKICDLPFGKLPGLALCNIIASENLFHAWDLAHATGQDDTIPEELVDFFYSFYEPQQQMLRESGAFGSKVEVAEDADMQTKLLALLGRKR
jgi:uncharacterized protein (TIGR03086 family)